MKKINVSVVLVLLMAWLAACTGGGEVSTPPEEAAEETVVEEPVEEEAMEEEAMEEEAMEEEAMEEEAMEEEASGEPYTIGLVMVGPRDDRGWNQAHWEGMEYVLENVPNTELVWFDKLNPADNPDLTVEQVVDDLVAQGAEFIITNSAEMADGTNIAAANHPDVFFIHASGDDALTGDAPANVSNVMGQMEFGKMIAGCAAAMASETGQIAYLGPLIDAETRRLVNSSYLGALHCWETVRGNDPADLDFEVVWIGFWFNIPGVTLDPTQVVNDFIDGGADVVISGIDTTEAVVVSGQRAAAGDNVFAVPYDFTGACEEAPDICLGVPYFNWGPDYVRLIEAAMNDSWSQEWIWSPPDWTDINNPDTSAIGWVSGNGLSADAQTAIDDLVAGLADGSLNLYTGPLNYQDGTEFVADGATASDDQIWYTEQLLEGIEGVSE
ncbi:MAG: BMP family ABC transporter substrate-binding protein [Ardenticatenaceae bacterium]|nr:BMP family ABC transporter substrate-binding protein [Ardenticatenaceae bacterium]